MKNKALLIWLILLEIPFLFFSYLYLTTASLAVYDASSHASAVWYLKNYLWPLPFGWNSFNLLGYVQGLSYPPLFHYLAATLAFFVGVDWATKSLIVISLLALPLSIYLFTKVFFRTLRAQIFTTSLLLLLIFVLPGYFGADLKGLVQIGLLPSFFSLPLVFLYFWSLFKPRQNLVLSSVLLASVLLTHFVAGIFCCLVLLCFALSKAIFKQFSKESLSHLALALLLSSFFLVPFFINNSLLSQSVHPAALFWPNLATLIISLVSIFFFYQRKKTNLLALSLLCLLISLALLAEVVVNHFLQTSFIYLKIYSLHLYRYQIYLYITTAFLLIYFPADFLFRILKKPRIKPEIMVLLPLLVLLGISFFRNPFLVMQERTEIINKSTQGRFIETFNREDSFPFVYTTQNQLVEKDAKTWAYGLFTDATPNGPYLSSLIFSFDPSAESIKGPFIERKKIDQQRVYSALNLFAINNLLFLKPPGAVTSGKISTLLLSSDKSPIVETPQLKLINIRKNWNSEVEKWWLEKGKLENLLVYDPKETFQPTKAQGQIEDLTHNKDWTKFSFDVKASEKVPVLVKFAKFPGWVAKENGKQIEIYQASPDLMLVTASGKIEFEFHTLWYQTLTLVISLTTVLLLIYVQIRKKFF
ncbi:MAG TPA: hypothetical protein VLE47_01915 [Candidatus Saccharimonadales bacterium]|nr:hypothetical protein [Candidatus Saccharimonadales bacterium]